MTSASTSSPAGSETSRSLAIIGMAGRFPGADNIDAFWRNLQGGVESISELTEQDLLSEGIERELFERSDYVRAAPLLTGVDRFDARFFGFTGREAALLDPQQRLFLECAWHALENAGTVPGAGGRTGVFAGANMPSYLMSNLLGGQRIVQNSTIFELQIHNDKDYLASRTAYQLGLTGPAVTVQTACSTSLVAVHDAARALNSGACDLALAGGVCVRVPQRVGYLYERGLIYSPDGHCRPFDEDGAGTVFGNGVGVVVLKRLAEAQHDGDRVLAVVHGSAVNNDGSDKVGYTSPSVAGQEQVIADALADSGVPARTVTAVEAHGTGTPIGDPIEINALTRAFARSTPDTGFCALSSVKSNIGHLESAAGIASLIKAVLQLRHRELVSNVHFRRPNPRIDFDATPFVVNGELRNWPNGDAPRRIGVSSFGIGGTNAHVVLEEAPQPGPAPAGPSRPQLVLLSGKTPEALDAAAADLAAHLDGPGAADLPDVAYTLQSGRKPLRYRRMLLAADNTEAASLLSGAEPERVHGADAGTGRAKVVFMFPGQGAQHVGMGRGLYHAEPAFAEAVDECAALLRDELRADLRAVLHDGPPERLESTVFAQPALFVIEYALARLLLSWGVRPAAMIGHSVGEFTAACLAGVLAPPDALHLVAQRGRLMMDRPPGRMLSVAAPESEVAALLPDGTSIAAVNAPELCVASGPAEAIAELERSLAAREIPVRPLHTSHAFHSPMMDPIVAPFTGDVQAVALGSPRIPFVSGVSGDWITGEQAADPGYWGTHARMPVRFGDAVGTVAEDGACVFVEVGPGNTLSTLARAAGRRSTVRTMRRPDEDRDDREILLAAIGDLWLFGGAVDWAALHDGPRPKVELPPYPFHRDRYWVEPSGTPVSAPVLITPAAEPADAGDSGHVPGRSPRPPDLLTTYLDPRDDLEREVAGVWEEFFGIAPIGVQDNFFELGGHSLLATQILNQLTARVGSVVPMSRLLANPTVAGLAAEVRSGRAAGEDLLPGITPDPDRRGEPFPLTEMQQAQWVGRLADFDMGGVAPHLYHEFDSSTLDVVRLERAWEKVVRRHDMLRMVVLPDGRQRTLRSVRPYRFDVLDLREESAQDAEAKLAELRDRMSTEVRRADTWPLWEIRISVLDRDRVRVHISFDLLVADVACFFYQILPEWREFYHEPDLELPAPELSFRDYVLAEQALRDTPRYEHALEYWRARVRELPPAPELPTAAGGRQRSAFVRRYGRLDAELWGRIKEQAGAFGVTPSSALLAAFAVAIGAWSKNQRFTLNFTAVNRLPMHREVDDLVGEFASFDLLEVDLITPARFGELAAQLQKQSWEDFEHRYVSGVRILRERARARGAGTSDVMPVVFTSALSADGDGKPEPSPVDWLGEQAYFISQTPQVTIDHFLLEFEGNLELAWHAVDELFPDGMMEEMFESYRDFVVGLASPEGWRRAPELALPDWQRTAREAANDTAGELPGGLLMTRLLAHAASAEPALITAERTLGHAELLGRAIRLARELCESGLGRGSLVGIGLPKGWRQIVATLAVSAAGCTYVPIDPALPESRRGWLIEQSGVGCVLVGHDDTRAWPNAPLTMPVREAGDDAGWASADVASWQCPARPGDVAYVIYTSGSTGTPKGVAVTHQAALNTVQDINERFRVGSGDRVLGLSSLSFDLSVYDVFGVLGAGGAVVLPETHEGRDPARWLELIAAHGVTVWNTVPALMQMLVEHAESTPGACEGMAGLWLALLSGDWIPIKLPDRLRDLAGNIEVISLGGATEAAVWSIAYPIGLVQPDWPSVPYGRPLRNQRFHVLNERMRPAPAWVPGELYIGGAGLAEGYWRDEQRTAQSFIHHPETGERLYRTGDLGRYLPAGDIEFLGREDFQVKIGGFRVELGEIEHALSQHPRVSHVVASAIGPRTQQRLVAHVVPTAEPPDETRFAEELRTHLGASLPGYMIPADLVFIDRIPLSGNGKVDRGALPEPRRADTATRTGAELAADDETVRRVLMLATDLLGVEGAAAGDNFFELGGDSITGVQLVGRANAEGIRIRPQQLFESATFAELAQAVRAGPGAAEPVHAGSVPLTPHQNALAGSTGFVRYEVPADFDAALAERAFRTLADRHTALRSRIGTGPDGMLGQHPGEPADGYIPEIDLSALPAAAVEQAVRAMVADMAGELDSHTGPTTKLALIRSRASSAVLVWTLAQDLVDDSSLKLLRDEFEHAYLRLRNDQPVVWGSAPGCALAWNRGLRRALTHPAGLGERPEPAVPLGRTHRSVLDAEKSAELAAAVAGAYHLELPEAVLAALVLACRGRLPGAVPQLLWERSTRSESGTSDEPPSPVIGRLTELVAIDPPAATDVGAVLRAIKDGGRSHDSAGAAETVLVIREFVDWGGGSVLADEPDAAGPQRQVADYPGTVVQVSPRLVRGRLRMDWQSGHDVGDRTLAGLVRAFGEAVTSIIEHCRDRESGEYGPTDFPLSGLSAAELDEFLGELN